MEEMLEFRLHGRGGQGIVVAAAIFAEAVFLGGFFARAFSLFGAERRGAPVTAFVRVSRERLMPRSRVYNPDYAVVFDSTLAGDMLTAGLGEGSALLLNGAGEPEKGEFSGNGGTGPFRVYRVDATAIAWKQGLALGSIPMVNTAMLGAMVRVSGLSSPENLDQAIKKKITTSLEANLAAAAEGYAGVREVKRLVS